MTVHLSRALLAVSSLLAVVSACTRESQDVDDPRRIIEGDTVVTITRGLPPVIQIDSVRTVARDPRLENPTGVRRLDDGRLVVADVRTVHLLSDDGTYAASLGREGDGPGEFRSVAGVATRSDTIVVLDARTRRISIFSAAPEFLGSTNWPSHASMSHVNLDRSEGLVGVAGNGVVAALGSLVRNGQASSVAIVWAELDGDSARILQRVPDWTWVSTPSGFMVVEDPLGPRAVVGIGNDGSVAWGTGTSPCVVLWSGGSETHQKLCLGIEPITAGDGVLTPSLGDVPGAQRSVYAEMLETQRPSSVLPYYDRVVVMEDGVWVRLLRLEDREVNPFVPGPRPPTRQWAVFDADGVAVTRVDLPIGFSPMVRTASGVLGPMSLDTGEVVIAEVSFQASRSAGQ